VIPWSPLAGGFLAGKYDREDGGEGRLTSDERFDIEERYDDGAWAVLDVVRDLADEKDTTPVAVSLAWLLSKDVVDAPIIGPKDSRQLADSLAALDVELTGEEVERLEAPIDPRWPRRT
jgi:aryl-alcohol dehydrogenase-like predicted oxidoreductase